MLRLVVCESAASPDGAGKGGAGGGLVLPPQPIVFIGRSSCPRNKRQIPSLRQFAEVGM